MEHDMTLTGHYEITCYLYEKELQAGSRWHSSEQACTVATRAAEVAA